MNLGVENLLVFAIVALSVAYLAQHGWALFAEKRRGGCGTCGSCPSQNVPAEQQVIAIKMQFVGGPDNSLTGRR